MLHEQYTLARTKRPRWPSLVVPDELFTVLLPRLDPLEFKVASYLYFCAHGLPAPLAPAALSEIAERIGEHIEDIQHALSYLVDAGLVVLLSYKGQEGYRLRVLPPMPDPADWEDEADTLPGTAQERRQVAHANARAHSKGAMDTLTVVEWLAIKDDAGRACICCGTPEAKTVLHVDHVRPLALGGTNRADNIAPLCGVCNRLKGARHIDWRPLRTKGGA